MQFFSDYRREDREKKMEKREDAEKGKTDPATW